MADMGLDLGENASRQNARDRSDAPRNDEAAN
jgi:hypothetical protein